MTLPFLVKDATRSLIPCSLHALGPLDRVAWAEVFKCLKGIADDQLKGESLDESEIN